MNSRQPRGSTLDLPFPTPVPLFHHRAFALFWGAQMFSDLALQAESVTIGWQVYTVARTPKPCHKAEIAEGFGATYVSSRETSIKELVRRVGRPDLIIDATGSSAVAFEAMETVGHNGVVVWTSITGGKRMIEFPADQVNLNWVLGNKLLVGSVNANFRHFEMGIADLALGERHLLRLEIRMQEQVQGDGEDLREVLAEARPM